HPQEPHPFPTRRSSDLAKQRQRGLEVGIAGGQVDDKTGPFLLAQLGKTPFDAAHRRAPASTLRSLSAPGGGEGRGEVGDSRTPRSEEHTSELQSRFDLV